MPTVPVSPRPPVLEQALPDATIAAMALSATSRHSGTALCFRRDGGTAEWSYPELGDRVGALARGLMALGVEAGDRVALMSSTRPEWTLADLALLAAGATVVPVYHTNSPQECAYVLAHSRSRAIICENAELLAKIESIRGECPLLEHVLTIEPAGATPTLDALAQRASEVAPEALRERAAAVCPEDLATIVYTSGTTGPPKGCMVTHASLVATMRMYERRLDLDSHARVFMFLPLAHSLARMVQLVALDVGASLAYWSGDPKVVLEDLAAWQPTHVPSVPRVFEKIRTKALAQVEDSSPVKRAIFGWALATGTRMRSAERNGGAGPLLRLQHGLADRLVLSHVRSLFGGAIELALTGAAPIGRDVLEFFDACGVLVLEGYGLTESCAAGTLNTVAAFRFGTVGQPLPGVDVAIADDGEILLRGANVFTGYHRDEAATAETLDGGWLLTGDLGEVDDAGFVRITGRKKDLIITSSGKNISPSNIEAALRESRWISQAVVVGDNRPYLVALLTLDPEEAPALAPERIGEIVQADVDKANERFARIEQVKRYAILDHDLTQDGGELTPTLKVKRAVVEERYAPEIERLYS